MATAVVLMGTTAPAEAYSSDPVGPIGWEPNGAVLAVTSAGGRVFVGGEFTGGVAALDASTGQLLWTGNADGPVRALGVTADGSHLIAGGGFKTYDGAKHRRLASIRVATGVAEPGWRASAPALVRDLVVHGDIAYFGGQFARHNGIEQRSLGAVDVATGLPVTSFTTATDGKVYGLSISGGRLFIAGRFAFAGGQPRSNLASVTLATGSLDSWRPAPACGGCNLQWDIVADGNRVYTVGRNAGAVVAYDAVNAVRLWRTTANGDAQALALVGGLLYVGGHFVEIGSPRVPRQIVAALNPATGAVDPDFAPRFVTSYPGVWALHGTADRLYVGGYFTGAGPSPPRRFPYFAMFA
ncbi:MAG TPA: PQQ-binding-like beta-propeller repeat protein [Micromonosporaceae bacterium]|nr:PQQ-binding-like beta-propeller repeat protein [Micromonosporaceae bacterium]